MEADGFCGDDVFEGPALDAGEDLAVDALGVFFFADDDAAAGAAQALVGGGGGEVGKGAGVRVLAAGDESGDVGHIDEEECAHFVRDGAHPLEVDDAGVGAGSGGDHFGLHFDGEFFEGVVVDALVFFAHSVMGDGVEAPAEIGFVAVGEVAAVGEVHGEDFVTELQGGEIDCGVGL